MNERPAYTSGHMEGFLMKRGKEDSRYQLRKFVLSEVDDTLRYYVKEKREPKAVLRISELNVVFAPAKIGNPNSLQLTFMKDGTTRHIYVYHDDPREINNWYMAVRCAKLHRFQIAYPSASESDLVDYLTHDFAREGWLLKTGPRATDSYKRRWFTLDDRKLMYHDDPQDANPKGEIFLGNHMDGYSVRIGAPVGARDQGFSFTLFTPERTYNLSSHSEQDRDEWMTVIQKVLERPLSPQDSSSECCLVTRRGVIRSYHRIFSSSHFSIGATNPQTWWHQLDKHLHRQVITFDSPPYASIMISFSNHYCVHINCNSPHVNIRLRS